NASTTRRTTSTVSVGGIRQPLQPLDLNPVVVERWCVAQRGQALRVRCLAASPPRVVGAPPPHGRDGDTGSRFVRNMRLAYERTALIEDPHLHPIGALTQ